MSAAVNAVEVSGEKRGDDFDTVGGEKAAKVCGDGAGFGAGASGVRHFVVPSLLVIQTYQPPHTMSLAFRIA
jgi:hypothetical protein